MLVAMRNSCEIALRLFVAALMIALGWCGYLARPVRSILLVGAAGAVMTALPPAGYLFVLTVPLGFITGAFAMRGFIALVSLFAIES